MQSLQLYSPLWLAIMAIDRLRLNAAFWSCFLERYFCFSAGGSSAHQSCRDTLELRCKHSVAIVICKVYTCFSEKQGNSENYFNFFVKLLSALADISAERRLKL